MKGDDLYEKLGPNLAAFGKQQLTHLDSANPKVKVPGSLTFSHDRSDIPQVSVNAHLGARAIFKALRAGADIVICGRVSDASPVIGAAWYWHSWSDTDLDSLTGAFVAGHLIECSAYATGANFSGFTRYRLDELVECRFPIAEIHADGTCVIAKHEGTRGMINEDTIRCQFLYVCKAQSTCIAMSKPN